MRRISGLLLAAGMAMSSGAAQAVTVDEAKTIAMDAYIYGYSLVTTEVTRVQMTNVAEANGLQAPMGQFGNVKRYPPADYRGVSAPNADTLYSLAWMDLDKEPWIFSHPDMGDRFFLFPTYDLWMPVIASPGSRTTGGKAASYLLAGPGWKGEVPQGVTRIDVPTRYVLILGRTYANGTEKDYEAVNALQAQYDIRPLSSFGKADYVFKAPPVDPNPGFSMTDKPQEVIFGMGTEGYFNRLAKLMCHDAPPAPEDAPIVAEMAKIGIEPCKPFSLSALGPDAAAALQDLPQQALDHLAKNESAMGVEEKGWIFTKGLGAYGTDYLKRGLVAAFGWPANLQDDAVYPYTQADKDGQPLTGAHKYTLTFAKGQEPPVNGFWSITMYEVDQGWWFVPNALNKFTVSPRDNLVPNADGSVTLYFQNESPGKDKEANWLPAPKGAFLPMIRMYWPKEKSPSILDGSWLPPQIVKLD
ncbi:DUF1254 domain-containing protein [Mesorhizobium sp. BR1-1-16]|uniref:DUF1254 domain-containing protein n=1 Tax=Mesorhizobium sp. BR1-1-16 TaxID=2876653 RepID=UPI001CCE48B2|nr:DUF1254 domain-containing protein [Mesorhizobium sp. BR1-1-16]MBZ9936100.1 DUF1254 domain-containing protein [Mesorhizobium sp. BR1-1-16]